MNEIRFIKNNRKRWQEFESFLGNRANNNPDHLAQLYVELTDDLAYSQSFFPKSKTTKYLNQLTFKAHQNIFKRRKASKNKLIQFFRYDYPFALYNNRRKILYAFLLTLVSAIIGVVSAAHDEEFARLILGDYYINMTLDNISNGNPMAVYGESEEFGMFMQIAWNNIRVAFLTFASGMLFSVGTFYFLFKNGMMVGVFQYFFFQKGVALASMSAIWLHGTIEIFSIIIAGAAGLVMGNSFLFPGTYTRAQSLKRGAKEGVTIVAGLIPFFILAAFIESYITRHYQESMLFDWVLIFFSIMLIIAYFFMYPSYLNQKVKNGIKR
jgi:uncharacterized membrane protein SpoIIM required for sporulation